MSEPSSETLTQESIEEAERQVASAAGRPRTPHRGQGFATDQQVEVAVETYVLNEALLYYSKLGKVTDTSRTQSFDYAVDTDAASWHVEVKGTTGDPEEVLLTLSEVRHADEYPWMALFIVSDITAIRDEHGETITRGSRTPTFHPWPLDQARLSPIGYRHRLLGDAEGTRTP